MQSTLVLRCVVCGRYARGRQQMVHVVSEVVGKPLKQTVSLADATADEETVITDHWKILPDDYQVDIDDRVCYKCKFVAPELVRQNSENVKRGLVRAVDKEKWLVHYKQLQAFARKFKHANCPRDYRDPKTNFPLGRWLVKQRIRKKANTLPPECVDLLTKLGVTWNVREKQADEKWLVHYKQLQAFARKFKHANCPRDYRDPRTKFPLGRWLAQQRAHAKDDTLLPARAELLTKLGVAWEVKGKRVPRLDEKWLDRYERVKAYIKNSKRVDLPRTYKDPQTKCRLSGWLTTQRRHQEAGTLPPECVDLLTKLGLTWTCAGKRLDKWLVHYKQLQAFARKFKHANCPRDYRDPKTKFRLGRWLVKQRIRKKANTLPPECVDLLTKLGVTWSFTGMRLDFWLVHFKQLQAFARKFKHANCPQDYRDPRTNFPLGRWLADQRIRKKANTLPPECVDRLTKLGVTWNVRSLTGTKRKR